MSERRKPSMSARVQDALDGLFLPRSVEKTIRDIRKSQGLNSLKAIESGSTKPIEQEKSESKADDTPAEKTEAVVFTEAQDKALLELKLADKSWKAIALEFSKDVDQVKSRWIQIKPADFEKIQAAKKAGNAGKGKGKGGGRGVNEQKLEQEVHGAAEQVRGGKKGKKGADQCENEVEEEAEATWAVVDDNWDTDDVELLQRIVNEEFRSTVSRVAWKLHEATNGRRMDHPDDIYMKLTGRRPPWLDLKQV